MINSIRLLRGNQWKPRASALALAEVSTNSIVVSVLFIKEEARCIRRAVSKLRQQQLACQRRKFTFLNQFTHFDAWHSPVDSACALQQQYDFVNDANLPDRIESVEEGVT
jgi:predicted nucleic acid-binding protein